MNPAGLFVCQISHSQRLQRERLATLRVHFSAYVQSASAMAVAVNNSLTHHQRLVLPFVALLCDHREAQMVSYMHVHVERLCPLTARYLSIAVALLLPLSRFLFHVRY